MPAAIPALPSPTERDTANVRNGRNGDDKPNAGEESGLNSPKVDATGKPTQRAVSSAKQAWQIAKKLRDRAKEGRIARAAQVASRYNADPPFSPSELAETGQGWRNNFSTNFLGSIVDRVTPQLTDPANKADLLTHSALPASYPEASSKSRKFCEVMTRTIRAWTKFSDLLSGIGKEVVLYGNAAPARIDRNWRPRLWGFGECFLPQGTGQHALDVQVSVFYQPLLLHEFLNLWSKPEVAKLAGYNIPGCVKTANKTVGNDTEKDPTPLDQQDRIREGGGLMGWSYENDTKTVNLFHVLVRDYTGQVDLWTVDADNGEEIRQDIGLHDDIENAIALFTFQSGNRKFYGSKGLGRLEANLHTAIERGRNLGADQMYLSGLLVWQGDPKDAAHLQAKVRHPFMIMNKHVELVQQQIVFNVEAWEAMDNKLVAIAESIAGAFVPPNLENQGSSNTKIEAAQKAEREMAVKQGVLGRFFNHVYDLVGMMQRGICAPQNLKEAIRVKKLKEEKMATKAIRLIARKVWEVLKKAGADLHLIEAAPQVAVADEEAVNCLVELLDAGLTPEEIVTLSLQPAGNNSADEGDEKDNRTMQWIALNRANPLLNQRAATELDARMAIGEDRAKALVIAEDDPNIRAKATRDQIIELSEMVDGNEMDVAGFDNHPIHREVLAPRLGDIIHALQVAPTTTLIKTAMLCLQHYKAHMEMDQITPKEAKAKEEQVMKTWEQTVDHAMVAMEKRQAELAAAGHQMGPDGLPVPVQGQPVQAGANGMSGEPQEDPTQITTDHQIKASQIALDHDLKTKDQQLRERELALKESQHDHAVSKDAIQLQQTNVQMVQGAAAQANKEATDAATIELQKEANEARAKQGQAKE